MFGKLGVTIEREKCNQVEHDLQERIKELQCLYGIAEVAERPEIRLDELYQEVVNLLPSSYQYPEITCARITIDNKKFNSKNFIDTNWKQSSDIKVHRAKVGTLEVGYIEARLELDEGPFLKEERQLIDAAAKLVSTITEHKQADEKVKDRLVLENSISQASRLFACQHDVDIKEVLRILGEAMSVNRAYIFQFRQNSRKIENTHEWCAPGTEPQIDNLQDLNPALVPWWMKKLVSSENIVIPDVDSLPAEAAAEKDMLQAQDILSALVVPIHSTDGSLVGFIGFDDTKKCREWSSEDVSALRVMAEIISGYMERKRMEQEIQDKNEQLKAANDELRASNKELGEAQEHLVRSEKLAAIGQLAGGIGHELRNPLGAIKNAIYYIKGKTARSELAQKEPKVMEFLNIIDDEVNSSNKIISDLLGFSRVRQPSVTSTRIENVIEDALSHLTIPENIELIKKLDSGSLNVEIDADQIQQVLVNIITNAVQATPEGGKLTIDASEKDKFLEMKITDTGCGIPQEAVDKIFNPLFTTKAKGIGLGLAVCKAIIDRHQGDIKVESQVGKGTTFTIKLPRKQDRILFNSDNGDK